MILHKTFGNLQKYSRGKGVAVVMQLLSSLYKWCVLVMSAFYAHAVLHIFSSDSFAKRVDLM